MKKNAYNTPWIDVVYVEPQQIICVSSDIEDEDKIHFATPNSGITLTTDEEGHVLSE